MVKFKLIQRTGNRYIYEYYPNGNYDKRPGTIDFDFDEGEYDLDSAEEDFECFSTIEEQNEMRISINAMRLENEEPELTVEEYPSALEELCWYYFADHAINKIVREINAGNQLEEGSEYWY